MEKWINEVAATLSKPLPGKDAQYKMASMKRMTELADKLEVPENRRVASVMLLLYKDTATAHWRTVLIQRSHNPNDRHSGQVSFPGGSWEASDGSLEAVALREAHEEVGVSPLQVKILGRLTELYIPVSNFLVHPFVGFIHGTPQFTPQIGEVAHILTPPVSLFYEPAFQKTTDLTIGTGLTISDVPYYDVEERIVWGATAMIMSEFTSAVGGHLFDKSI
jgi:8-oxo-dGTP pyrophosphatase MutT (NUDIX family)